MSGSAESNDDLKILRTAAKYGLTDLLETLADQWATGGGDGPSTREVADRFNKQALREALRESDYETFETELDVIYDVVRDDEQTSAEALAVRERLVETSVPTEELRNDFVSHQTVHTYFTDIRDLSYERDVDPEKRRQRVDDAIQKMKSRTTTMAGTNLDRLRSTNAVAVGDYDIVTEVTVYCRDCGGRFTFGDILERGRCDCA
jgi:hypothetical protein